MKDIPAIGNARSEEEYLNMCREAYRNKQEDTEFMARTRINQLAKKLHPTNASAETQAKAAISHLLRSKVNRGRLDYITSSDRDKVMAFLDGLEKLMEVTA